MVQTSLYSLRNKSQAPLSHHTMTRLPDNLDRTFQPLYASKCSIISASIYPKHASTPKQQSLRGSDVGITHIVVLPRAPMLAPTPNRGISPCCINRTIEIIACSSLESVVFRAQLRVQCSALNHKQSANVGEVSIHRYLTPYW
jgi:hypothetical protein